MLACLPSPTLPWLDGRETRPIATQIAAETARRIATGAIEPGALLREVDLAAEHGASRTPAREAMLQLEAWRLVRLLPKKGALVSTPTAREREELLSVRAMLEEHAVSRIAPDETRRSSLVAALAPVPAARCAMTCGSPRCGIPSSRGSCCRPRRGCSPPPGVAYAILPATVEAQIGDSATIYATGLTVLTLGIGAIAQGTVGLIDRLTRGRALVVGLSGMSAGMILAAVAWGLRRPRPTPTADAVEDELVDPEVASVAAS